ncbi:MAG: hypothetical protein F4Z71_11680 [Gammaproteobacteria bacterium]|nr:hypothetical protein [Gammaproteobacteria bacterium]
MDVEPEAYMDVFTASAEPPASRRRRIEATILPGYTFQTIHILKAAGKFEAPAAAVVNVSGEIGRLHLAVARARVDQQDVVR